MLRVRKLMVEYSIPKAIDKNEELTSTHAFQSKNDILTTFKDNLERSILDLVYKKESILMSDILTKFGNYPKVHDQVKKLVLENKVILHELEEKSVENRFFHKQELRKVKPEISKWVDLSAQPCLTCPIYNECGIDNPVSPAKCEEFNAWLNEEIDLEFDTDEE